MGGNLEQKALKPFLFFNANQCGEYKCIRDIGTLSKANKSSTSTSRSSTPNRISFDAVSFESFEFSRKSNETTDFARVNASHGKPLPQREGRLDLNG